MTGLIFVITEILDNPGFFLNNNTNRPSLSKAQTLLHNPRKNAIGEIITEAIRAATDANAHRCPDDDMPSLSSWMPLEGTVSRTFTSLISSRVSAGESSAV